jgi:hypothetical protein
MSSTAKQALLSALVVATNLVDAAAVAVGHGPAKSPSNSTASAAKAPNTVASTDDGDSENWRLSRSMVWSWIVLIGGLMIFVASLSIVKYLRTIVCFPTQNQKYFSIPSYWYSRFRKYFWDSPLFSKRHHREFQLSKVINVGTLPSRSQTTFLVGYFVMVCLKYPFIIFRTNRFIHRPPHSLSMGLTGMALCRKFYRR